MWIVCNNIFVGNSVRGDAFSSRHSPHPAPDLGIHMSKSTLHWSPSLNYFMVPAPPPSQRLRLRGLLKTDSIQRQLTTVYGANAGQRVIKPCLHRKFFFNRFCYDMVSFSALCEFSKMFTRPTWQNLIFFKFFCLIVFDLLGLKPNTVRSNLGESKQGQSTNALCHIAACVDRRLQLSVILPRLGQLRPAWPFSNQPSCPMHIGGCMACGLCKR